MWALSPHVEWETKMNGKVSLAPKDVTTELGGLEVYLNRFRAMFLITEEQSTMEFRDRLRKVLQDIVFQCKDAKKHSGKGSKNAEF